MKYKSSKETSKKMGMQGSFRKPRNKRNATKNPQTERRVEQEKAFVTTTEKGLIRD